MVALVAVSKTLFVLKTCSLEWVDPSKATGFYDQLIPVMIKYWQLKRCSN
jgi:hypothetical protein